MAINRLQGRTTRDGGFSVRRVRALTHHDFQLIRTELGSMICLFFLMPIVTMFFFQEVGRIALERIGYAQANGSEEVVPGMALLFGLFIIGDIGRGLFREYAWGTWDRLRASGVLPVEILLGKMVGPVVLVASELALVLIVGWAALGLESRGSLAALALVILAVSVSYASLGLALTMFCRKYQQVNVVSSLGGLIVGGLGGAFIPRALLPSWAQVVSSVTPPYWGMRGFRSVILDGVGVMGVVRPVGVLLSFGCGACLVAAWRFRIDEQKTFA